ncbi:ATP-binding cassette domain-containing protein [Lutibacter sp.]|uniref:peptidase domain-containing ABC transporter n=1 Tax=Lutibacter sp. TaxID=1925666 RepID=UPI0025BDFA04|nr:ATP-binding cassette domain-containing protein [Lutibacter sp.]MCF6168059.1 ATP-binding cassette domain-containing protein [Lutibacter sp.]
MSKKKITPVQRFFRLLKPDVKEVRNIYVYSAFSGLISLSLPLGIQAIVNLIQGGQINTSWIVLVILVVLGVLVSGILQIFQMRITENLQQKIFIRAAFDFSYRIPHIKMEVLYKHYAPELMNRFLDISSVQKGLSKILIDVSSAFFIVIFSLLLLSLYHPFFILFSILLILLIYLIFKFTANKGMVTSLLESKFKYKIAHWLEEISRTIVTFKLAGKSDLILKKTDKYLEDYLSAREGHFKVLIQQYSLTIVFKIFVATGFLAIGGVLVMNQQMNIGQFIAAEIIILIVMASVEKLVSSIESIYDILTSLEKIGQVTDLELDRDNGIDIEVGSKDKGMEVEIENISFTYPDLYEKTLNNVSLSLDKGELIVLTGGSGSGKSTLLFILSGIYQVREGAISYNKLPIGNLSLNSIREQIGEHLTMGNIFEGTVLDNITLDREMASFENVKWAIENLGLNDFVRKQTKGYNTMLATHGNGLPESTITKLLLARSIVTKPKLLLLENTFKSLDEQSCEKIIDFITNKKNGWSVVAVSSYPYLIKLADKIAVLKEGKIISIGTHDELKGSVNF